MAACRWRGVFPFVDSFDDIGPFTVSVADMRLVWDVLSGTTAAPTDAPLRIARLGGRFRENADADQLAGDRRRSRPTAPLIELPDIARARSAAFLMTACEGGALHRAALRRQRDGVRSATRDRLIAGALLPTALYDEAQAFRADLQRAHRRSDRAAMTCCSRPRRRASRR